MVCAPLILKEKSSDKSLQHGPSLVFLMAGVTVGTWKTNWFVAMEEGGREPDYRGWEAAVWLRVSGEKTGRVLKCWVILFPRPKNILSWLVDGMGEITGKKIFLFPFKRMYVLKQKQKLYRTVEKVMDFGSRWPGFYHSSTNNWVTWGKLPNFSVPQFPQLQNGDSNSTCFTG